MTNLIEVTRRFSAHMMRPLLGLSLLTAIVFAAHDTVKAAGTFIPAASRIDMVYDSAREVVYITNGDSVLRYHLGSDTFMAPFVVPGANLGGIDISPDGNTLVVADRRRLDTLVWVYVVNLQTEQLSQQLFPRSFMEGGTFTVAYGNADTVLITSTFEGSGWIPLRKFNPGTGQWSQLREVRHNSMVTASGDLGIIGFVEADSSDGPFGRYRIADGNFVSKSGYTDGTSWFNYEIGVNRDGTQYAIPTYNGTYICDANLTKFHIVGQYAGPQPIGVVYHPVENTVYFAWRDSTEIRAYDTASFSQTAAYDFEHTFANTGNHAFREGRLRISRDGSLLFATVNGGVRYLRLYDSLQASDQSVTTNEDSPLSFTLNASVGNGGALSHVVTSGPAHGTLSGNGLNLTYTPHANYNGPDSFTYKATYGAASSAEATVSITVTSVNAAPTAQPDSATTPKNAAINIAVLANDEDLDGDQLSLTAITSPANGTASITSNGTQVNYRPRNGFTGIDSFTYTVSDGHGGVSMATVTVNVTRK
ncbi:MAG TPA: cadherin-like domain-containing protein [Pyrinomonadaceae bacterium]|nr:cadherin-like domain-containing protein [Pyrinomonadaceae bacterium]